MNNYYKIIENGYILSIGDNGKIGEPITEEEYNSILSIIQSKPADTLESIYRLSAETEQYEPFTRTHEETVDWCVQAVSSGTMTLEEVPEEYRAEVEERLPEPEEQQYTLDEAATLLAQEVSQ